MLFLYFQTIDVQSYLFYLKDICCNRLITMIKVILIGFAILLSQAAPINDLVKPVPGYPDDDNTTIYSGYLDVMQGSNPTRGIHYVFVESINGPKNNDPVTLWLNGGPGCSSMLGFLQQIGPYYLEEGVDFRIGDKLKFNKYSWHNISNLLFFESPAGVGYSYNDDKNFKHNDATTAYDNLKAVLSFFKKFKQYEGRKFFIAGQSYAGKYIPDLAMLIDEYNLRGQGPKVNLQTIIIGNGVMSFKTLQQSTYQFMIDRRFVDPQIIPVYHSACKYDPDSAGCRYFQIQFDKGTQELNPYNVYSYCYYNDSFDASSNKKVNKKKYISQESILNDIKRMYAKNPLPPSKFNGAPCAYFDGIHDYFQLNTKAYNAKNSSMMWNGPCAEIDYTVDPAGSMASYRHLLSLIPSTQRRISIVLYNGNWDAVVPYVDTIKGIKALNLVESYIYNPWYTDGQHSGFQQLYSGIIFILFKGASHQVPQSKRAESFSMFSDIIKGAGDGSIWTDGLFSKSK